MRQIKLVISDMDGTALSCPGRFESSWELISYSMPGIKEKLEELIELFYEKAKRSDVSYSEWIYANASLLKDRDARLALDACSSIPYTRGFRDFVTAVKNKGINFGLVTAGVNLLAERIEDDLNLDFSLSNHLLIADGKFNGRFKINVTLLNKANKIKKITRDYNLNLEEVCFIGDSENDIPVFKLLKGKGLGVAYNPKTEDVRKAADLYVYGYKSLERLIPKII